MKPFKKLLAFLLSAALFSGCAGCGDGTIIQKEMEKNYSKAFYNTAASANGKSFAPVSGYSKKFVGMFYCLWNGDANWMDPQNKTVYDVSDYEASGKIADTVYGGSTPANGDFHYWGEPLYGYYRGEDTWVIRRHLELFLHAGIDFLCFDTSNALIYEDRVLALLKVWQEYEALGYNVPKLMFMTNTNSEETPFTAAASTTAFGFAARAANPGYWACSRRGFPTKTRFISNRRSGPTIPQASTRKNSPGSPGRTRRKNIRMRNSARS